MEDGRLLPAARQQPDDAGGQPGPGPSPRQDEDLVDFGVGKEPSRELEQALDGYELVNADSAAMCLVSAPADAILTYYMENEVVCTALCAIKI